MEALQPPGDPKKNLRTFGLLMGGVLSIFTTVFFLKDLHTVAAVLGTLVAAFVILALAAPMALNGVYVKWMKFAVIIGNFNTKLILGLVYMTLFTITRSFFILFRKDPLKRKFEPSRESYWEDHENIGADPKRYEKPF